MKTITSTQTIKSCRECCFRKSEMEHGGGYEYCDHPNCKLGPYEKIISKTYYPNMIYQVFDAKPFPDFCPGVDA
jgi:hypothetical protein